MLHKGDGLVAGGGAGAVLGVVGAQQLHQGSGELFSPSARPLGFEGVPVAFGNRQLLMQGFGQGQGLLRPESGASGPALHRRRRRSHHQTRLLLFHWTPVPAGPILA